MQNEVKRQVGTGTEKSLRCSNVAAAAQCNESEHPVVEDGEDIGQLGQAQATTILTQEHIAAVVQAVLNAPVSAHDAQEAFGIDLCSAQAGHAIGGGESALAAGGVNHQTVILEDLLQMRPVAVTLQQAAGGQGAGFEAAMRGAGLTCRAEVGLGIAEAGFGWRLRGKEVGDLGFQSRLIGFDLPHIVAAGLDDLQRQLALGKQRIAGDDFAL